METAILFGGATTGLSQGG